MYKLACLSLLALGLVVQPAMAQNRFMDEAKEKAARRAENAAVREAEHPETVAKKPEPAQQSSETKPAENQAAAQQTATSGAPKTAQ
jgi:hypothetical protein